MNTAISDKQCVVNGCGRTRGSHPATSFFSFFTVIGTREKNKCMGRNNQHHQGRTVGRMLFKNVSKTLH